MGIWKHIFFLNNLLQAVTNKIFSVIFKIMSYRWLAKYVTSIIFLYIKMLGINPKRVNQSIKSVDLSLFSFRTISLFFMKPIATLLGWIETICRVIDTEISDCVFYHSTFRSRCNISLVIGRLVIILSIFDWNLCILSKSFWIWFCIPKLDTIYPDQFQNCFID